MSINQHQFEQLTEMGISLWQHRTDETPSDKGALQPKSYLNINLNDLTSQQLFNDILLATGLSIGEINHQSDHLNLGLFNWYFTEKSSKNEIQWLEQQLVTPSIDEISKSPALKKQLWQLLTKQIQ
jgi:DNA polymerase III psi subunit